MSTRGCYIFKDTSGEYVVYKHGDNYPSGAADSILGAFQYAWELPRFEANEFGAAFVVANKQPYVWTELNGRVNRSVGGEVRLCSREKMPWDIAYIYVIYARGNPLAITSLCVDAHEAATGSGRGELGKKLFSGTFRDFHVWAKGNTGHGG